MGKKPVGSFEQSLVSGPRRHGVPEARSGLDATADDGLRDQRTHDIVCQDKGIGRQIVGRQAIYAVAQRGETRLAGTERASELCAASRQPDFRHQSVPLGSTDNMDRPYERMERKSREGIPQNRMAADANILFGQGHTHTPARSACQKQHRTR